MSWGLKMLFTEQEKHNLKYFNNIANLLNIYIINFKNSSYVSNLVKYYSVDLDTYSKYLKDIIFDLEDLLVADSNNYKNVNNFIEEFYKELQDNVSEFSHADIDKTVIIKKFFVMINSFLNKIKDWIFSLVFQKNDSSINDNPLLRVVNSEPYTWVINYSVTKSKDIDSSIQPMVENDKDILSSNYLNNKIIILEDRVANIIKDLKIFLEDYKLSRDENFDEQRRLFEERANDALINYQNSLDEIKKQYQNDLIPQVSDLKSKLLNNKTELDSLLGDVKLYQDKMTNKAVAEMSAHYFDKSKFERNSYFAITLVSAIIIIFSVISAYIGVNSYYNEYVSTKSCDSSQSRTIKVNGAIKEMSFEECMKDLSVKREATQKYAFNYLIFRLSFSLLLFLAVIYASRIAMRAYNHWRQSENMYLKLNTLSPFIGSLDKSVRNDVHLSLVPDYFGKDAGMVESSKDAVKDLPTNISNIAIKAIEQAGSTIGSKLGSDKETKNSDSESSTEKNKKKSTDDPE